MSFSYSGNPASSSKDQVRFLIQDTAATNQQATDEEIDWVISTEANIYMAAALVMEMVARRSSGIVSKKVGDLSITYRSPAAMLEEAKTLRARGRSAYQIPTAGGISVSEKLSHEQDTDIPKPSFKRNRMDNPETTIEDEESPA